jgi:hypothetical protein
MFGVADCRLVLWWADGVVAETVLLLIANGTATLTVWAEDHRQITCIHHVQQQIGCRWHQKPCGGSGPARRWPGRGRSLGFMHLGGTPFLDSCYRAAAFLWHICGGSWAWPCCPLHQWDDGAIVIGSHMQCCLSLQSFDVDIAVNIVCVFYPVKTHDSASEVLVWGYPSGVGE